MYSFVVYSIVPSLHVLFFFFDGYGDHRDLHSFPTRRSSDRAPAVFTTAGTFVDVARARARPLEVAASNWLATALLVVRHASDAILVDVGSTTADVIPLRAGRVDAVGRTDPERLLEGELVYTGAIRTN